MKAAACAKHFAVHSGPEDLRHEFNAVASKQDLYETYLPAFKACVQEGHVEAVMGAYNRTNGEPCCGSPTLLQDTSLLSKTPSFMRVVKRFTSASSRRFSDTRPSSTACFK